MDAPLNDDKVIKLISKTEIETKREKNELADHIKRSFKSVREKLPNMSGFALVCWDNDGESASNYMLGESSNVHLLLMPELVKIILQQAINE